jgi:glyoxylase-like metal-dependent hydrolase (beta-lactamase superfamily II)
METRPNAAVRPDAITRRQFAQIAGLAVAAGLALPRSVKALLQDSEPATTVFNWRPVGERVRIAYEQGGNALVLASSGSALLIDCKNAGFGPSLLKESQAFAGALSFVVNTHHHADHTGGNPSFSGISRLLAHHRAEPRILAQHERYIAQMGNLLSLVRESSEPWAEQMRIDAIPFLERAGQLDASDFGPNDLVSDDGREIRIGELRVELVHAGPGHTDNDLFIVIPGLNMVHTGDLLFYKLHPFIDRPAGATTLGWIKSLEAIIERCNDNTIVVPGHGEVTDVTGLHWMVGYFKKTREEVQKAIDAGKARDEVLTMSFAHFDGIGFEQLRERVLGAVYDELIATKTN